MKLSKRGREITLVALVAIAAVLANLPEEWHEAVGIDRNYLLGLLALTVFISLFLYLRFQFFFLVVLLALAANMPGEVAPETEFRLRDSPVTAPRRRRRP